MKPSDLGALRTISAIDVHRDRVAFVVSTPDLDEDRYDRRIWVGDRNGVRPFTAGPGDSSPVWSPDGSMLAFLRTVDKKPQGAVMPTDGGEPMVVTDFACGAEALEWSPDGSRLVVVGVDYVGEWIDLDDDERGRRPRRIDRSPYRFDGMGWTHDRRRRLCIVDPSGDEEPRLLTDGDFDEGTPVWTPDGSAVIFTSDRRSGPVADPGVAIWTVPAGGGTPVEVVATGNWAHLSYSPAGVLHMLGHPSVEWPRQTFLCRLEDDGAVTLLTEHLDRSSVSISGGAPTIAWDGDHALTNLEDAGAFGIIEVAADGTVTEVVGGHQVVHAFGFDEALFFARSTTDNAPELWTRTDDDDLQLTTFGGPPNLRPTEHFTVVSDGNEIDVWVVMPDGDGQVPTLLNIHGGPASQYGHGFFDEFQVYADAGYGVVACNPRGSSGKGQDFVAAVVGDGWGNVDVTDILSALGAALDRFPRLDRDRIGVMGGSYGGFMTAWLIGQDDRFSSAVVERGLLSFTSFGGTSDIGATFGRFYTLADYPDAWDLWWEKSPLSRAENVTTPTLVLHSENDFRCPVEQAEQYFMALARSGVTTEFLRFPGEGHEMSRSGSPKHRVERFEAILDWHGRFLEAQASSR